MNSRIGFVYFLTAGVIGVLIVLIFHASQLTQTQQDILSATLGGLLMALQSTVHAIYNIPTQVPTTPVNPANGAKT